MRRSLSRGNVLVASLFAVCLYAPASVRAQTVATPKASTTAPVVPAPAPTTVPRILIGQTEIVLLDKTRQPFRDPEDNSVCVPPEAVASVLGTLFSVDETAHTATFTSHTTGASVTCELRPAPRDSDAKGAFVALSPLAERLGGKCEYDAATDTLYIRSVLTLVEMVGSEVRVTGTLPITPKITRINGGKTVAFDFAGAEVGLLPKNLTAVAPGIKKARTGQFDTNTARIVLDLAGSQAYTYVESPLPSGVAVLSCAPGAGSILTTTDPAVPAVPPVVVGMGADGKPLPSATVKPTKPGAKPSVPTALRGVRFVNVSDTQARIIVDASAAPAIKTALSSSRLVVDIQNGVFGTGTQTTLPEAVHPLLKGVSGINTSATTAQLVMDLSRAVNFTVRLDPKGGFVVDLTLPRGAGGRIAGKLIVVDPGHGGDDHGAPGVNGAKEKNVALGIARKLAAELQSRGANVILTRDSDSFVTLGERSEIANRAGADLFIAVHADSAGSSADGSNIYYHLSDQSGRTLATCVSQRVAAMGGIRSRGPRSDGNEYTNGFSVLRRTKALAILCETGFMSNYHDASLLVQSGMQDKIARAIASGVQDYIEGTSGAGIETPDATPQVALSPAPAAPSAEEPRK